METDKEKNARFDLDEAALFFHKYPTPGKLEIQATKPLGNQRDLALAYSPGVAAPCLAIRDDPALAADYTARANLVAVVSNGTAVLGLGNIGPLASKPVMEGKAVLFKKFAGIDVFDIEIDETDPDKLVDIIASLEPTFGGINLEDIKAPECFEIERRLRKSARNGLNPREYASINYRVQRLEQRIFRDVRDGNRYGYNDRRDNWQDRDRDGRNDRYEDDRGYYPG